MIQFHYRLGLLCEEKKDFRAASEAYQRFLHFWKDAERGSRHPGRRQGATRR